MMKNSCDISESMIFLFSVFGSEQVFSLMKNIKSRTRMHLTDEHLEGCAGGMSNAATEIKPDIERPLKQKQCQIVQ
jgi:hypothetical protein